MNITEFIEFAKKHGNLSHDDEELKKNWNDLLEKSKKTNMLRLCFHTLLEISFPCAYLKEIIEYEEKGKQEILSSEDTFKWACAFGEPELIVYLNDKVKEHNINGAIQATISQYRLDNLKTLVSLGYEKEIYREPNLCQAISTASMVGGGLVIVDYLLRNRKKFPLLFF